MARWLELVGYFALVYLVVETLRRQTFDGGKYRFSVMKWILLQILPYISIGYALLAISRGKSKFI